MFLEKRKWYQMFYRITSNQDNKKQITIASLAVCMHGFFSLTIICIKNGGL
jgi:hypothetical protein